MTINKTVYTLGDIDLREIIARMKMNNPGLEYYVYKTDEAGGSKLKLGVFHSVQTEENAVILGVASSRRLAQRLVVHIVKKALELDEDILGGVDKLIEI